MSQVTCPHCGVLSAVGAFCESCGKALPAQMPTGPRVVSGPATATTSAGQKLQVDELAKTAKKAQGALLLASIVSSIAIVVAFAIAQSATKGNLPPQALAILIGQAIVAVVFWGLWFWSRYQPLPAAIVGLVIYATLVVINIVTTVSQASEGRRGGIGGIGIGWLDIVILAALGSGISAGVKHRKLLAEMSRT